MHLESDRRASLMPKAWLVILLNALYNVADSLCSVFVSVYLYINSMDVEIVFQHYITLYIATPIAFIFAGWYAKTRDRTHVFRIGLILHAVYYALLLYLREDSVNHVIFLGAFFGITWGFFWAGNNTFQYDYSTGGKGREYFLGLVSGVGSGAKLVAPFLSGAIIATSTTPERGYRVIFSVALVIYLVAILVSFRVPHILTQRPFRIGRALFPPREHRDWRLIMVASASLAGSFHIFHFLMGILMYIESGTEAAVGGYVSLQGLVSVITALLVGHYVLPHTRSRYMFWGVVFLVTAGLVITWEISMATLIIFAFLRSVSLPLFGIPHTAVRFEVMQETGGASDERIEYLCAWEVPLALGRVVMMSSIMALYSCAGLPGLRFAVLLLCLVRIGTYFLVTRVSFVKNPVLVRRDAMGVESEMDQLNT